MRALEGVVSIHDVAPETFERVAALVDVVRPLAGTRVSLLVVPGLEWLPDQLDRLRRWSDEGFELAGHGWMHRGPPRSPYHRLHALVISRDQAEHLSRSRAELRALVARGFTWFARVGLPEPRLYVPPAWALGALTPGDLQELPYRWYEVQTGYTVARDRRHLATPLVGFEADTRFRQVALRLSNALNAGLARALRRPVRVGLHPHDLRLRLSADVHRTLARCTSFLTTAEAISRLSGVADAAPRERDVPPQSTSGGASPSPDSARLRASDK